MMLLLGLSVINPIVREYAVEVSTNNTGVGEENTTRSYYYDDAYYANYENYSETEGEGGEGEDGGGGDDYHDYD